MATGNERLQRAVSADELSAALGILKSIDFSVWPGLYDKIPWRDLEDATKNAEG